MQQASRHRALEREYTTLAGGVGEGIDISSLLWATTFVGWSELCAPATDHNAVIEPGRVAIPEDPELFFGDGPVRRRPPYPCDKA
jgi:hypothetical protein